MISTFIYLAKASGLIALFFTAYYLLLKKETFFIQIRFFLLSGLIIAFTLPLLTFSKTVWITPEPLPQMNLENLQNTTQILTERTESDFDWWQFTAVIYVIGTLFFLGRFIIDILRLINLLRNHKWTKEGEFRIINTENINSPFSFFRYIVYNSVILQPEELKTIIDHEKVHSRQLHSLDMIISQLACVFLWFNPLCWLYKKQITQNLEFIADAEATKLTDNTFYQKTLLKITLQEECIAITNHFYQSLIKKRIVMLNKKQSKKYNFWKFAVVLPALSAFIYLYQIEVVAKERIIPNYKTLPIAPSPQVIQKSAFEQLPTDTIKGTKKIEKSPVSDKNSTQSGKIIVVNGVIQTENVIYPSGKEMIVNELPAYEAIEKYGDRGKNGAVEYTTTEDFDPNSTEPRVTTIIHSSTRTEVNPNINTSITDRVKQMNASPYRTVSVTSLHDKEGNAVTNDDKTSYFVINKTTTDIQLNSFKEDLGKQGIVVTYSDIVRNSTGAITNISLKLSETNAKSTAKLTADGKKNGISDIYIGRIKGKLTASSVQ